MTEFQHLFQYEHGYKLGLLDADGNTYINNHLIINLKYSRFEDDGDSVLYRIVGFDVLPHSVLEMKGRKLIICCISESSL